MKTRISLIAFALAAAALTQEASRPPITGVAHISLFCHDIAKSRHFYKDFLGYDEPFQLDKSDGTLALTFIKVNDRQFIELNPETAADTDRLNHISVETPDASAMRLYLAERGVKVPDQVPTGRIGNANYNIKDPDGHAVEIVQYLPAGWTAKDRGKHLGPHRISDRMAHIGITVANLDAATRFYTGILGFREIWRGSKDDKVLSWVNSQVPDGDDYLEFMLEKPSRERLGTMHHICLFVPDIDKAVADLESRPARQDYDRKLTIQTGINHRRQCNLYDPDGTRVELMEPNTVDGKPVPPSTAPAPVR